MTWNEYLSGAQGRSSTATLESRILAKLGGRLEELSLDDIDGRLVIRGRARSYHVKQLVQHEVMALTNQPILMNHIEVLN